MMSSTDFLIANEDTATLPKARRTSIYAEKPEEAVKPLTPLLSLQRYQYSGFVCIVQHGVRLLRHRSFLWLSKLSSV